jgi:hypothetical protein
MLERLHAQKTSSTWPWPEGIRLFIIFFFTANNNDKQILVLLKAHGVDKITPKLKVKIQHF